MQKALCVGLAVGLASAKLVTKDVMYMDGAEELRGYLAYDDEWTTKHPGVLVAADWDGMNGHEKEAADRLVGLGYVAFANGVYTPAETEAAVEMSARGQLTGKYASNNTLWRGRFAAAVDYMKTDENIDPAAIGAIGFCFGGGGVLEMARSDMPDVMGVVSIHGNFGTQEPASTTIDYKTRVLVLHGASDNNIMNTVARGDNSGAMPGLEKELGDAKIPWEITKFAGVGHGFAAQGRSYDADATERSWASLGDFFGELFKTAVMELPDQPDDASGDIVTEMITYLDGNQTLEGYLAYSKTHSAKGLLPSVLVSHDWDGITEHERTWARSLAAHGYLAFTSAVFTPEEDAAAELPDYAARGRITGRYASDPELHRTRMQAAVAVVEGRAESMKGEVAAVGFCFGGGSVLELARANVTGVKGVVSMHGSLGTKMPAEGDMATRVLVLHGAIDNNIISAQRGDNGGVMPAFEAEMDGANAKWEVTRYSGVVHSFTEPAAGDNVASGNAYDSYAAKRAWSSTLDFLNEVLEKPAPAMAVPAMAMEETDMESGAEKAAATFAACLAVLATVFLAF